MAVRTAPRPSSAQRMISARAIPSTNSMPTETTTISTVIPAAVAWPRGPPGWAPRQNGPSWDQPLGLDRVLQLAAQLVERGRSGCGRRVHGGRDGAGYRLVGRRLGPDTAALERGQDVGGERVAALDELRVGVEAGQRRRQAALDRVAELVGSVAQAHDRVERLLLVPAVGADGQVDAPTGGRDGLSVSTLGYSVQPICLARLGAFCCADG